MSPHADPLDIIKGVAGLEMPGHRYIERQGAPGAYRYRYEQPKPGHAISFPSRKALEAHLNSGHYSIISAGRNAADEREAAMQEDDPYFHQRHEKLRKDIEAAGLNYSEVDGHYAGHERSFVVRHRPEHQRAANTGPGHLMVHHQHPSEHALIRELGKKYNQNSVIHVNRGVNELHYTAGPDAGQHHKGSGWSWQDSAKDYYTDVAHPGGQHSKFSLNFDWDHKHAMGEALHKGGSGGEGSRGGKVIGHTKRGKAVYASGEAFGGWNEHDHRDAFRLHLAEAIRHRDAGHEDEAEHHYRQAKFQADIHHVFTDRYPAVKSEDAMTDPLDILKADDIHRSEPQEFQKARRGDVGGGHGYAKRTGMPGAYTYHYEDGSKRSTAHGAKSKTAEAVQGALSKLAPGDTLELVKLLGDPGLAGTHIGKVMSAVEALQAKGVLTFDGVSIKRDSGCCGEAITEEPDGLSKGGGEGSRGGHVIGHSRLGAPVYESAKMEQHHTWAAAHDNPAVSQAHRVAASAYYNNHPDAKRLSEHAWAVERGEHRREAETEVRSGGGAATYSQAGWPAKHSPEYRGEYTASDEYRGLKKAETDPLAFFKSDLERELRAQGHLRG